MPMTYEEIIASMDSVIADVQANIEPGKLARPESVRDSFIKIAEAVKELATKDFAAH